MPPFRCATLSPVDLSHVRLAVATAQTGGVGLLDAVHTPASRLDAGRANLALALAGIGDTREGSVGLRLRVDQLAEWRQAAEALAVRGQWIVLCDWTAETLQDAASALTRRGGIIWAEARSAADLDADDGTLPIHGWAACGAECGGLTGQASAFILTQHLARQARPFLVRGGIGVHSAAACRVAGAFGVILDDAVLLLDESPLAHRWRQSLRRLGLADTQVLGGESPTPVRVVQRPDWPAAQTLRKRAASLPADGSADGNRQWRTAIDDLVGWGEPDRWAWPIGEGAARAAAAADRYATVGRLVAAVTRASADQIVTAHRERPFAPGAPLARAQGTRYPIVQGPMTRVSDRAKFAAAVARAGALPMIALALMRQDEAATVLLETADRLAGRTWGVGILGFVPDDLRLEQLDAVAAARPPFALVAGGRPEHAASLEARGIKTYLHTPAPLLEMYLDAGVRRLVFEGAECGGHIGPLHGFALWDFVVDSLLRRAGSGGADQLDVLFAGGIHDALSAAMVAALAAPLAARGVRVGLLMGTAYLFARETVATHAITETFQAQARGCRETATIETGPGHVVRCIRTPFVQRFAEQSAELRRSGLSGAELREALEALIVGRSRIASKGLEREGGRLHEVSTDRQLGSGLFMIGEAAGLREDPTDLHALHADVSLESTRRLKRAAAALGLPKRGVPRRPPADVAIVGAACVVPGAQDPAGLWHNLLTKARTIQEIPLSRWDWRLYYDPAVAARDRIISKWGGFIDPVAFDPMAFGIPPKSLSAITLPQLLALELTRRALVDAGYAGASVPTAVRARTAVVFGLANPADLAQLYATRANLPLLVPSVTEAMLDRLPEWTEESYPGVLSNVVAGRVANRFDFGGPNFTIDAACASSLAALDSAVQEVGSGRSDLAIAGGIECEQTPHAYLGFSHTRALSPRGRADVFDRGADGIVISEGAVILVLKRLADAARDGDRVYAVIKGIGGSSDGRGRSLTAPRSGGQRAAFERAYEAAGVAPRSLGLYEAHATGTAVGDATEVETICSVLEANATAPGDCVIGSAKSLLGHTRAASGMASVLKAAMALHHRVLPPHAGVTDPLPALTAESAPVRLLSEPAPWLARPSEPRRAGVSAFGFGGANYHVVLEACPPASDTGTAPLGAPDWPVELFAISAPDIPSAIARLDELGRAARWLEGAVRAGVSIDIRLRDLACASAATAATSDAVRVALVAGTAIELLDCISAAERVLKGAGEGDPRVHVGVALEEGRLGFLFPGQGSQYPGMGAELSLFAAELRDALEVGDRATAEASGPGGTPKAEILSRLILPAAAFSGAEAADQARRLADTRVAQPAIGIISCGMLDFARRLGIEADVVAGHSYGEFVALHAAGCLSRADLLALSIARGRAMHGDGRDAGVMAAVDLDARRVSTFLDGTSVVIANCNAPDQTVLSGAREAVSAVVDRITAAGHGSVALSVSGAFHSPLMAAARAPLADALARLTLASPRLPVFSNFDGQPYPASPEGIGQRLARHLESRVDFVAQIEAMYDAGVRLFVEMGPGRVLSGLVKRTLRDRPHTALAADGGVRAWLIMVARMFADGRQPDLDALFAGRATRYVDLTQLPDIARPAWSIGGGHVWAAPTEVPTCGKAAFLDEETRSAPPEAGDPANSAPGDRIAVAYREYQQTMRSFLDQQERWLQDVIAHEPAGVVVRAEPAAGAVPAPAVSPPPAAAEWLDRDALVALLVKTLADRTGYAPDALRVDLDLEADLGIDSIKRIELAVAMSKLVPGAFEGRPATLDRVSRLRTLAAIADVLAAETKDGPVAAIQGTAPDATVVRSLVAAQVSALPQAPGRHLSGLHLVTADQLGVASRTADILRRHGAKVQLVETAALADRAHVRAGVDAARATLGPVTGLLHLAPIGRTLDGSADLSSWRREASVDTKSLHTLLQSCAADLAAGDNARVLAASGMGGYWGRQGAMPLGAAMAGGCHGLLRCFEREYPVVRTSTIDVDATLSAEQLAEALAAEFLADAAESEVGLSRQGRVVFRAVPATVAQAPDPLLRPSAGWVVLALGGARGITADVCVGLAGPGVRLILVGRDEAGRPQAAEARRRTCDALAARGADVTFLPCDVRDRQALGGLIDGIYDRHGRLDAVIHGAGVIEDQRFDRKSDESFDRVFDTKVDSTLILGRHVRADGLKWVVFFGSIAGRFGNPGQADYAAANETLARLACGLSRQWPASRVVTIQWGPWSGTGMASEPLQQMFAAQGIGLITPEAGRRFFMDEILGGRRDDVEVIAGSGWWTNPNLRTLEP